ncbi:MAG: SNF2-related protein, partial [Lentisphaeria bacterium]|nr:SNF2-related protein [Lentisphaeria bacterium]
KEPISTKGPRLTSEISMPGRIMVLMPFQDKDSESAQIKSSDEKVRFRQQQAMLLQAVLDENVQDVDGKYQRVLDRMREEAETSVREIAPPEWFAAQLRPYQQIALSWLASLEQKGLSGILADDMGLGKTVEVLSMLALRHEAKPEFPSLVVVPSSLVFNWTNEAAKFAPRLKVGQYYGSGRIADQKWFEQFDVVLTTYGTMRIDAVRLSSLRFDYVILDESQAIKNCDSATAKAACALRAEHRLAMTGTPVENHLAELFSQLTFLNPGLFSKRFTESLANENSVLHSRENAMRLHQAVAPFILRRRKEQVAPELPPKTEQILWCELEDEQRAQYDNLRDFYRQELSQGAETSNMLAALLRLRQAACHTALINEANQSAPSAKTALLHEQLASLIASGHKALVFSQFTTLLKLVACDIEASGWKYCYLDGETKNREEVVKTFQEDAAVSVFLISLKAGGVGLNLTAADYVYLLDPWWNPAAEAQAIDRTYRIGQTRPVFAYRMISKGTVEEKVLQMQQRKQRLATSALGAPMEAPVEITAEDMRRLLE